MQTSFKIIVLLFGIILASNMVLGSFLNNKPIHLNPSIPHLGHPSGLGNHSIFGNESGSGDNSSCTDMNSSSPFGGVHLLN